MVGEKHLKLQLARGGRTLEAMRFNSLDPLPASVRAAYRLSVNEYNGVQSLQLVIEHWENSRHELRDEFASPGRRARSARRSDDTPTAAPWSPRCRSIARAQTWGEEVYFEIPVEAKLERGAKQVVAPGTVCFWVEGSALALPWGRTPISEGDEPKLVTRCNVLGKIDGDPQPARLGERAAMPSP